MLPSEEQARERRMIEMECELQYLREQATMKEARLNEIRCVREVQAALLAVESLLWSHRSPGAAEVSLTVDGLRSRAHLLTSQLDALEDEAARLQLDEPGRSALEARRRIAVLSARCEAKREMLRCWPEGTVQRLIAGYDAKFEELLASYSSLEQARHWPRDVAAIMLSALSEEVTAELFFADAHQTADEVCAMASLPSLLPLSLSLYDLDDALAAANARAEERANARAAEESRARAQALASFNSACSSLKLVEGALKSGSSARKKVARQHELRRSSLEGELAEVERELDGVRAEARGLEARAVELQERIGSAPQREALNMNSKQLKAAASAAAAQAKEAAELARAKEAEAKAAAKEAPATPSSGRIGSGAIRKMTPQQAARLAALKGKYGTHVASNMKQKLATETTSPGPTEVPESKATNQPR
ncbi:hypothetical protein AB1Y20_009614 [Prymnesium parvum]|uniref:Cilia- and flagella-associated protein 157 n=1 Tax=Prymnesium parvum TaxID=97485 RepID=A0AB34K5L3_PRYPA